MTDTTRRLRIHGHVQGVFFRAWSADLARSLGLAGWVRNRHDGTVEMLLHGPDEAVRQMTESCRRGPPSARVERIDVEESDQEPPSGFEKRPTV